MTTPVQLSVKRLIDESQLKADLAFSQTDLSSAMMTQASMATHYGMIAAKASRQTHDLELALEVAEAKVYRNLRDASVAAGEKVTEAQLAKSVAIHPTIVALNKALNESKQVEAQSKTAVEAFRQRRDMLVQAGLLSREEMKGEVSISRRHEVEGLREDQRRQLAQKIASASRHE